MISLMAHPRLGKSYSIRLGLLSWWRLWKHGYRGPMPYVIGPGWKSPRKPPKVIYDEEWKA